MYGKLSFQALRHAGHKLNTEKRSLERSKRKKRKNESYHNTSLLIEMVVAFVDYKYKNRVFDTTNDSFQWRKLKAFCIYTKCLAKISLPCHCHWMK